MALKEISLDRWIFAPGEESSCLEKGREVAIPHTWNVEDGTEELWGTGWYELCFVPEEDWRDKRVRVCFRGVYHDALVYVNGREAGGHKGSGYTPFVVELTDYLQFGKENRLTVKADNRFSSEMLPCERSFDWANDGGMIRPACLMITGKHFLREPAVRAVPVITAAEERQESGYGMFGLEAQIDGAENPDISGKWVLYEGCDDHKTFIQQGECLCGNGKLEIPGTVLEDVKYWHFDSPNLYTVQISLFQGGLPEDQASIVFGFRDLHVQGARLYLNGEPVRLPGSEWMPGSDPAFGMAETREQLEKMLLCLKETNSVLTRFHWQQDDWVYDWCDRHGMLVQEEVPFWGRIPPKAGNTQWELFQSQIKEMVAFHRNHPSIFAWGVGNELDAQCEETIQYIKDAVAFTHRLDSSRPVNYVSNSIFKGQDKDGTMYGDIMMVNDYIGTWHQGYDQYGEWDVITAKNPDKPFIPSEFGLCEPAFEGGDERRNQIFLDKIRCYRKYPAICGTVYFCLNDYRTQMGEDGEGKMRKRIHGSADLVGTPKPSCRTVQREYSPLTVAWKDDTLTIVCRDDLPCYTVKGYMLEAGGRCIALPDLKPGERWSSSMPGGSGAGEIRIYRPNKERVL